MNRRAAIPPTTLVIFLVATTATLSSCAILSPPPPRAGGDKLSDAAKETRKKPADQTPVTAGEQVGDCCPPSVDVTVVVPDPVERPGSWHPPVDEESSPARNPFAGWHGGLVAAGGRIASADFAPFALYGLRVGGRPAPRTSLDLALLGGPSRFAGGSDLAALLREPVELGADVSVRYGLMPENTFLAVAPLAGFRFGTLFWRYRNGLKVERDGELRDVSGDWINDYSPYVGASLTLARTPHFEVGAVALTGWRFYDAYTQEGLRNDLFRDTRFTEIRLETTIPF